jgi:hydroxymethylbilane synthase
MLAAPADEDAPEPTVEVTLVIVETAGDRNTDVPLHALGGQGVFVKEVQAAVLRGEADAAVHSAKDLPAAPELSPPGLMLAAFPERADPRDLLVGARLANLPPGATVATGSVRRRTQLANLLPDLTYTDLRGNLGTRLAAVGRRDVVAVVVAKAAADRLGWEPPDGVDTEVLDQLVMVPQVGQGALAVECRTDDGATRALLAAIDDAEVRRTVSAERTYLAELGGSCTLPVGAHAVVVAHEPVADRSRILPAGHDSELPNIELHDSELADIEAPDIELPDIELPDIELPDIELTAILASEDGRVVLRQSARGKDPERLGRDVARYLLDDCGGASLGYWGDLNGTAEAVP